MGSMLVTVLFWLTVGLIVAALVGEFRDTWTVTEQNTLKSSCKFTRTSTL